jgi:hypothetical protein
MTQIPFQCIDWVRLLAQEQAGATGKSVSSVFEMPRLRI